MKEESAYRCGLYRPGHDVHYIQARLAARNEPDPKTGEKRERVPGHLLEVRSDGLIVIEAAGGIHRVWNHDPERLERLAVGNAGLISYQPGFHLLAIAHEVAFETLTFGEPRKVLLEASHLFCVAAYEIGPLDSCSTRDGAAPGS
jgi:hypothetical protein